MATSQHTGMISATKVCTGCHRALPATRDHFHKHPSGKYGLQAACRECQAASKRRYYKTAAGRAAVNAYRAKNIERIIAYNRSRPPLTEAEAAAARERAKRWYWEHRDQARQANRNRARLPHVKAKNKEYQRKYQASRLRRNGEYALRHRTRSAIVTALKQGRTTARGRWWEAACGYTLEELRQHLQSQFTAAMTWENRGTYWEIDHIRPLAGFVIPDADCPAFREAWGLHNLRPLEKSENRAKGGPERQ